MSHLRTERLAISIALQCTDFRHENQMKLCKLPLENSSNFSEASAIVKRFSFGKPNQLKCQTKKTVLLTGATGSGKTTWINAMVNYVLGVEWDDPFRFILVDEDVRGGSQAHSQTQEVTVYDLHCQDGFRIPFSLTIVDTPGFGDTGGIAREREIISGIEQLFKDDKGIEELEAVGFVVQSPLARLTQSQKYIFSVIDGMFANGVKENIRFLVTFCDGRKPLVLDAIKEAKLACQTDSKGLPCYQKFNNGAIYVNNQDEEDNMSPNEWKNGMTNFKSFFDELSVMPTKSLQETKDILRMANNDTRMLAQGATARHDAIAKMKCMLTDVDNIRKTLSDLKMEVEKFQQDINISKTVGTATNAVGVGLAIGGCALAFVTGGVSLVLTFGGLAATVAGTGVNVGADLADKIWTKGYLKTITNLASSLQKRFEELEMSLAQYWTIVQWLKQSHGLDENWSVSLLQQLGNCALAHSAKGNVAAFAMAGELYRTIEIAKSVGTLTTTATGGTSYVITKTLSELTAVETAAVKNIFAVARTGATVLGKVLEGSFIALNFGMVVFEIVSLVNSWTNNHPAVIAIDDLSEKLNLLENEIKQKLSTMEEVH